jgi:methyl-accepting chemotaxis protein
MCGDTQPGHLLLEARTDRRHTARNSTVDLDIAIQKHAQWKFKFLNALHNKEIMDAVAISRDNNCELGKWLHGDAEAQFGKEVSYAKCVTDHAVFHVEAGKIAVLVNAHKADEAERLMAAGSAYDQASRKVAVTIIELKNATHTKNATHK